MGPDATPRSQLSGREQRYIGLLEMLTRTRPHYQRWPRLLLEFYQRAPDTLRRTFAAMMVYRYGIHGVQPDVSRPIIFDEEDMRALARRIGEGESPIRFELTPECRVLVTIAATVNHTRRMESDLPVLPPSKSAP